MTERKWTPPSWQSGEYYSGYYQALKDSAADDLYEALAVVLGYAGDECAPTDDPDYDDNIDNAIALLDKALGEQHDRT